MKRLLTGREAAERLGVRPVTLRSWKVRGQGPPYQQPAGPYSQTFYDPDVIEMYASMFAKGGKHGQKRADQ